MVLSCSCSLSASDNLLSCQFKNKLTGSQFSTQYSPDELSITACDSGPISWFCAAKQGIQQRVPANVESAHKMLHSFQTGLLGSFGLCLPWLASCSLIQPHQAGKCGTGHVSIIASFMCVGACLWALHNRSQTVSNCCNRSNSSPHQGPPHASLSSHPQRGRLCPSWHKCWIQAGMCACSTLVQCLS